MAEAIETRKRVIQDERSRLRAAQALATVALRNFDLQAELQYATVKHTKEQLQDRIKKLDQLKAQNIDKSSWKNRRFGKFLNFAEIYSYETKKMMKKEYGLDISSLFDQNEIRLENKLKKAQAERGTFKRLQRYWRGFVGTFTGLDAATRAANRRYDNAGKQIRKMQGEEVALMMRRQELEVAIMRDFAEVEKENLKVEIDRMTAEEAVYDKVRRGFEVDLPETATAEERQNAIRQAAESAIDADTQVARDAKTLKHQSYEDLSDSLISTFEDIENAKSSVEVARQDSKTSQDRLDALKYIRENFDPMGQNGQANSNDIQREDLLATIDQLDELADAYTDEAKKAEVKKLVEEVRSFPERFHGTYELENPDGSKTTIDGSQELTHTIDDQIKLNDANAEKFNNLNSAMVNKESKLESLQLAMRYKRATDSSIDAPQLNTRFWNKMIKSREKFQKSMFFIRKAQMQEIFNIHTDPRSNVARYRKSTFSRFFNRDLKRYTVRSESAAIARSKRSGKLAQLRDRSRAGAEPDAESIYPNARDSTEATEKMKQDRNNYKQEEDTAMQKKLADYEADTDAENKLRKFDDAKTALKRAIEAQNFLQDTENVRTNPDDEIVKVNEIDDKMNQIVDQFGDSEFTSKLLTEADAARINDIKSRVAVENMDEVLNILAIESGEDSALYQKLKAAKDRGQTLSQFETQFENVLGPDDLAGINDIKNRVGVENMDELLDILAVESGEDSALYKKVLDANERKITLDGIEMDNNKRINQIGKDELARLRTSREDILKTVQKSNKKTIYTEDTLKNVRDRTLSAARQMHGISSLPEAFDPDLDNDINSLQNEILDNPDAQDIDDKKRKLEDLNARRVVRDNMQALSDTDEYYKMKSGGDTNLKHQMVEYINNDIELSHAEHAKQDRLVFKKADEMSEGEIKRHLSTEDRFKANEIKRVESELRRKQLVQNLGTQMSETAPDNTKLEDRKRRVAMTPQKKLDLFNDDKRSKAIDKHLQNFDIDNYKFSTKMTNNKDISEELDMIKNAINDENMNPSNNEKDLLIQEELKSIQKDMEAYQELNSRLKNTQDYSVDSKGEKISNFKEKQKLREDLAELSDTVERKSKKLKVTMVARKIESDKRIDQYDSDLQAIADSYAAKAEKSQTRLDKAKTRKEKKLIKQTIKSYNQKAKEAKNKMKRRGKSKSRFARTIRWLKTKKSAIARKAKRVRRRISKLPIIKKFGKAARKIPGYQKARRAAGAAKKGVSKMTSTFGKALMNKNWGKSKIFTVEYAFGEGTEMVSEYSSPYYITTPKDNPCRESHGNDDKKFCVVVPIVRSEPENRIFEVTDGYKNFECPSGRLRGPLEYKFKYVVDWYNSGTVASLKNEFCKGCDAEGEYGLVDYYDYDLQGTIRKVADGEYRIFVPDPEKLKSGICQHMIRRCEYGSWNNAHRREYNGVDARCVPHRCSANEIITNLGNRSHKSICVECPEGKYSLGGQQEECQDQVTCPKGSYFHKSLAI